MTFVEENIKTIKKLALELCYDRYLCWKAGIDYNNPDYTQAMIYVLQQQIKQDE